MNKDILLPNMLNIPAIRVWDNELNEMLYENHEQYDDAVLLRFSKHLESEDLVYMVSTCKKDKTGKECFVQDIIQFDNIPYLFVVKYDKESASYLAIPYEKSEIKNILNLTTQFTIISNTYEFKIKRN